MLLDIYTHVLICINTYIINISASGAGWQQNEHFGDQLH